VILADTSVWIDHFRAGSKELEHLLNQGQILIHPWIVAELALGSLRDRTKTLSMLDLLPHVRMATTSELRHMIETRRLYNLGIGLTDAHLMASAFLNPPTVLWTRDKQLRRAAEAFSVHAKLP
jgi:predicted nucleic acid-binding protein